MPILQASFFWKNDKPGGIGVTFTGPGYSPEDLERLFCGKVAKRYMVESDQALGSKIVQHMLEQLAYVGQMATRINVPENLALMCALNILWLSSRGFIPNDEFNGVQFISELPAKG